jgi:predicted transcriptional regulator
MSDRDLVIDALSELPNDVSFDEIIEQVKILAAIRRGEEAADAGRVISQGEIERRAAAWAFR